MYIYSCDTRAPATFLQPPRWVSTPRGNAIQNRSARLARGTARDHRRCWYNHCNTLQHTADYCNALQHAAAYCNTVQHISKTLVTSNSAVRTHCNTLQHTGTHMNTLRCVAMHTELLGMCINAVWRYCHTLLHIAAYCNTIKHTATHCSAHEPAQDVQKRR